MRKLNKYLKNKLFVQWVISDNEEVNDYWENWMKANPESADEVKKSRELFRSMKFRKYEPDSDLVSRSWDEVERMTIERKRFVNWNVLLKVAAVIVFFIVSYLSVKYIADSEHNKSVKTETIALVEKRAEKGVKLTVQLPDGSIIKLNSNSELIYPKIFASDKREVQLIGEGYFHVAYDKGRPFIVKSENLIITVLGTKFSINAFNKNNIKVALVKGSVKVEQLEGYDKVNHVNTIKLDPGFKAIFSNNVLKKKKIDELLDLGWKDDIIVFNNDNIDGIAAMLENWYGVDITIKNREKISESFRGIYKNETLVNVLESMGHSMNFRYEKQGNKIFIEGL